MVNTSINKKTYVSILLKYSKISMNKNSISIKKYNK